MDTSKTNIPALKPFLNVTRTKPCLNEYLMTLLVRLEGYRVLSYDPENYTYERVGGVNFRYTIMYVEKTDEETITDFLEEYKLVVNRKDEDAIHVEIREPHVDEIKNILQEKSDDTTQRTMSFMMMSTEEGTMNKGTKHGGGTGSYEP